MANDEKQNDEMQDEYDFSVEERGRYARSTPGTNVVILDPDVAAVFTTAKAVNDALRAFLASSKNRERGD
jgi:hypothetical protein